MKPEPFFPNYNDSILNLSCSILSHYGIKPLHPTLPRADELLAHRHRHVVLILLDGLGVNVLQSTLTYRDFLCRHLVDEYSSVFPPTTTAATTTLLSGKSPVEHGWLGRDVYFEQEDKTVTCFKNTLQGTRTPAADYNVADKYLPYDSIIDQINNTKNAVATAIFPFGQDGHLQLDDWINAIKKSIKSEKRTFTYAYWEDPNSTLHKFGQKSQETEKTVRDLNAAIVNLCDNARDTIFFITADHGHTPIQNDFLQENYPELAKMLVRQTSIEPRAISFYVKPRSKKAFPQEFKRHFNDDYVLFTREEALSKQLFGPGEPNPGLTGIGDFIAAAVSGRTLLWNKNQKQFRSHHAGLTEDEMKIPLICYRTRPKRGPLIVYYTILAALVGFLLFIVFH